MHGLNSLCSISIFIFPRKVSALLSLAAGKNGMRNGTSVSTHWQWKNNSKTQQSKNQDKYLIADFMINFQAQVKKKVSKNTNKEGLLTCSLNLDLRCFLKIYPQYRSGWGNTHVLCTRIEELLFFNIWA